MRIYDTRAATLDNRLNRSFVSAHTIQHTHVGDGMETVFMMVWGRPQWRRYVVKSGCQGQAIKLFQITPYVNDFQTLNNPGS